MHILERIRHKTNTEKLRLIWIIVAIAAVLLLVLWALSYSYRKQTTKETSLFQTFSRSFEDVRSNLKFSK